MVLWAAPRAAIELRPCTRNLLHGASFRSARRPAIFPKLRLVRASNVKVSQPEPSNAKQRQATPATPRAAIELRSCTRNLLHVRAFGLADGRRYFPDLRLVRASNAKQRQQRRAPP